MRFLLCKSTLHKVYHINTDRIYTKKCKYALCNYQDNRGDSVSCVVHESNGLWIITVWVFCSWFHTYVPSPRRQQCEEIVLWVCGCGCGCPRWCCGPSWWPAVSILKLWEGYSTYELCCFYQDAGYAGVLSYTEKCCFHTMNFILWLNWWSHFQLNICKSCWGFRLPRQTSSTFLKSTVAAGCCEILADVGFEEFKGFSPSPPLSHQCKFGYAAPSSSSYDQ